MMIRSMQTIARSVECRRPLTLQVTMPEWYDDALCAQIDPESFFPEGGGKGSNASAKKVCRMCPVRLKCLDYALANSELWGVWGGLSRPERQQLRRAA